MDTLIYISIALGFIITWVVFGRKERKGRPIPGPAGWPLVGYAFHLSKAPLHEIFTGLAEKYGDIFQINVFGKPFVVLNSMEKIRAAFSVDPYNKSMNDRLATFFGEWLFFNSQGIAFMTNAHGSAHGDLRKVFARGMNFFGEGRTQFEEIVRSELENLVSRIDELNGKEFDMTETLKRSLTNIVSIILGGHDIPDDDNDVNMFWDFLKNGSFLLRQDVDVLLRTFPFLRWLPGLYKDSCDKIEANKETILKRYFHDVKARHTPGKIRGLVDFMIEEQLQAENEGREVLFTDDRIKAMTLETIGAGIMTTLAALSTAIFCLIDHPEHQVKIQEELDRVVGREELPSISDRKDCVFIEAFLMECQRFVPVANVSAIHFCGSNIEFQGYDIPAKTVIVPNIWYVHHDEKVWGDPWEFRPERWLDQHGDLLPNDDYLRKSWLPFGVGRRQCIGEGLARSRMFLYIATLLQRWKLELSPDQAMSSDPRKGDYDIDLTIKPKAYLCRVVPRHNQAQ